MEDIQDNGDIITGDMIREAAKKIHEAGGWDAGITEALDILLSATGYSIEEVLEHEEA